MLQIRLLGQFDLRLDGKRVTIPTRVAQSLLAYLTLTAGTAHRREKLAESFGLIPPMRPRAKIYARNCGASASPSLSSDPRKAII
jgi:hypothetical protein